MAKQIKKKTLITIISVALAVVVATTALIIALGNKNGGGATIYSNENDPLVFSSQEVDKVFNPFFSTAAPDSNVVGLTQIGMI
ncbi:MAG: hypothetical protein IJO25_06880, partial [Clostridia bacterium]|nr:hypothetical protein [Clostridia bacterium]